MLPNFIFIDHELLSLPSSVTKHNDAGGLRADLTSKGQGKECFEALLCPLSLDYPPQLAAGQHFPRFFFSLPMQLSKPLLPCASHTTVTVPPVFVLAGSIPAHLGSGSVLLRGTPWLFPFCASPSVGWAQPGAPIWPHWSAATHHLLSQMLGPTVLPPEHCASLLGTFALWGGFPWDPAVQVPEPTEFVPVKSRAINSLICLPHFLQDLNWQMRSANLTDSLGNAAIYHHIPRQFFLTCERKIWMSTSLSLSSFYVKILSQTYSRNWITCTLTCRPSRWLKSPVKARAWGCKVFPNWFKKALSVSISWWGRL